MSDDDGALEARLRSMWESADPPPADLADRALFLLELADLESDLLRMQEVQLAGARGEETTRTVTFDSDHVSIMITLSGSPGGARRLDGWITPPAALAVEARTRGGSTRTAADASGRFSFPELPPALTQFVLHPTAGAAVELARPIVTPPLQI
jgi:hypothetical protein